MSNILIPEDIIGDPEYDGEKQTLTFHGTAAVEIALILQEARKRRERTERANRLNKLIRETAADSTELASFAQKVLDIYEIDR